MFRAFSSLLPSASSPDETTRVPIVQGNESKQPRKLLQPEIPESEERSPSDLDHNSGTPDASGIPVQNGSSGPASPVTDQEEYGVQGTERPEFPDDVENVQAMFSTPETIDYDLESGSETADPETKRIDSTSTYATTATTTTTEVEERKGVVVQKVEQSVTVREGTAQPRKNVYTFSKTSSGQQRYEAHSSVDGGVQRKTSFYQDTHFPTVTESGQFPAAFSASNAAGYRRSMVPSKSTYSSVREQILQIQRLHREEMDHLVALMTEEHEEYKRSCEEQFAALEMERAKFLQEISASASRISLLEFQLISHDDGHPETDKTDINFTTTTTTITTITSTIMTVTTRIEKWKHTSVGNKGQVIIPSKELDQLSLDLSNTSSQLTELQQHYAELSRDFISVRNKLQGTLTLGDEKDRTIASLTAEVAQWTNADAAKAQQITVINEDNETLRRDLSTASSRTAEVQQRYDAQSGELGSARNELRTKTSLIEERDRTIHSLHAEVARWKESDAAKAKQITTVCQDNERIQRDLSASSSQKAELQKQYDAQSKELGSVRNELKANKSLVEEKERAIITLTAEVDQWKLSDADKAQQFAAEHQDKERLQRDLVTLSARIADLQKRYDAQSKEDVTIRNELNAKVSLLEEKELTISSLTTEVAQTKRTNSMREEQLATTRGEVEQLRIQLSSASSQFVALQDRYEEQSTELDTVRDELHRIQALYLSGTDQAQGEASEHEVAQHIAGVLDTKNEQIEELRRDLTASNARNVKLQGSYEALSRDISAVRDELKVKTSQDEGTITSLTAQVDQWKRADTAKAERITTVLGQVEKLQQDLSTSTSQLSELQGRYDARSRELISVRNELQNGTLSNEGKDRTIASLTAEVDQWKRADANKEQQIATVLKQVEELQRNLSTSASQLAELQGRYDAQSRKLDSVRNELQTQTSLHEGKDHTIASLTTELDQWKGADAAKAREITATIQQVEKLQKDLSVSTSQLAELQGRCAVQSRDLVSVRDELKARTSSYEEKDRMVVALTAQVEEWKRTDALKEERILAIRRQAEDLQQDLTHSSSRISELQQRYDLQSKELSALQVQLQDKVSDKDGTVSSLISQVEEWKRSDATKADQLTTARKDLEQLRRNLTSSSSQLVELQQRYETRTSEFTSQIEGWKRSDASKTEELTATRRDLEKLSRDLSASSSQIVEYQQRCTAQLAQSAELTSQIEQWKRSDADKAEELATAREKLERLQHDLSVSSSRITEFQQRYEAQSTELNSLREQLQAASFGGDRTVVALKAQIEEWRLADAAKAEELARARRELEQLQSELSSSSPQPDASGSSVVSAESKKFYQKITTEVKDYAAVIRLTATVDQWLRTDAKRAEDLAFELERRNKENEVLRDHLVTLKDIYIRAPELKEIFQSETIEIQRRYEEQSKELRSQLDGVQRFVTTADTYADAVIIQMLQKLNAEVQHSTTFMAERMIEDFRPRAAKLTRDQGSAVQRVSESIGQVLEGCLGGKDRDDVALYLSIAFQAHITYYLRSLISSWTTENVFNDLINKTYEQLQKSEAQTISGRWRALTRTYISPACMSDPKSLLSVTVSGLSDIVVAAGCASSPSVARSKISSQFGDKVSSIISVARQFSKMIGETVSADFEVLAVRPAQVFDEATMEEDVDDYGNGQETTGETAKDQKVLCSTQLGMTKRMQLESGKSDTLTVIKAKVVLESFLLG